MIALTSVKVILLLFVSLILSAYCLATCSTNCSTVGKHLNIDRLYPVQCLIQSTPCPNLTSPDGYPSAPEIEDYYKVGWYLYQDPANNKYKKIGLNFSWSPGDDATIRHLEGFKVTVQKESTSIVKYFCLGQKLDFFQNYAAKFVYNATGYCDNTSVNPGQEWTVSIQSLPESKNSVQNKIIKIPECGKKTIENVYDCYQMKLFQASLHKNNIDESCEKRSVTVEYYVPPGFGKSAIIMLDEKILGKPDSILIHTWPNLETNGSFEVILPSNYDMQGNYSVTIVGDNPASPKLDLPFDFQYCQDKSEFILILAVSIILSLLFLIVTISITIKCLKKKGFKYLFKSVTDGHQLNKSLKEDNQELLLNIVEKSNKVTTVFIIFVDDHPQHKRVVSTFADFLTSDLGFNVIFELYQTKDIYPDPVGWMDKSFSEADKVIVIWSPGAVERWNSRHHPSLNQQSQRYTANNDVFTPIVIRIFADLFRSINMKKYFFAHFNYFNKDDIPKDFIDKYPQLHYTLMQQMEDIYFQLKDMEMYAPGFAYKQDKVDFEHYSSPKLNKFGQALYKEISQMHTSVKENPYCYVKSNTMGTVMENYNAMLMLVDANVEITSNILDIIPPSNILTPVSNITEVDDIIQDDINSKCLSSKASNDLAVLINKTSAESSGENLLDKSVNFKSCDKQQKKKDVSDCILPSESVIDSLKTNEINIHVGCSQPENNLYDDDQDGQHKNENCFGENSAFESSDFACFDSVDQNIPNEQCPTLICDQSNVELASLDSDDDPMESLKKINALNSGNPSVS